MTSLPVPAGATGPRRRRRSVRTRVSLACAAVAVALVVTLAALVVTVLTRREYADLDRRLELVSQALLPPVAEDFPGGLDETVSGGRGRFLLRALAPGLVATAGQDGAGIRTAADPRGPGSAPTALPVTGAGTRTVEVEGGDYRLLTASVPGVPGGTLTVGLPAELAAAPVRAIRLWGIIIGGLAALAGAGLGWASAGIALRPLRQLRDRTRAVDGRSPMPSRADLTAGAPGAAVETEQLAEAIAGLLERVDRARAETERTMQNARDFAAAADHELRTPLTTIQTDLDVLRAHPDLDAAQRREILDEIVGAQSRMVETLQALRALAEGDVAAGGAAARGASVGDGAATASLVDVAELAQRCVDAARPAAGEVRLYVVAHDDAVVFGSPGGLRLAVENLISNALRHARARRVEVSVARRGEWVVLRVDDDGIGVPAAERERVFERFARGSQAAGAGSGLGLALAAQQAILHGGRARLTDSPWGGLCAEIVLPAAAGPQLSLR